jgi:tRNA threonylcarbamoyladenosine biosynthesis protein TsaB
VYIEIEFSLFNFVSLLKLEFDLNMALIVNIETATKNCSVALAKDGKTVALKEIAEENFSHAEKLHLFIASLFEETGYQYKDLQAVAVSQGPGSYTGLRIGVSAAKGFCYALSIPMIAVDTLLVLAKKIEIKEGVIIPMIDARRMEAYTAIFDSNFTKIRTTEAEVIDESSYQDLPQAIHLIGDGAMKFKHVLTSEAFHFHPEIHYPSAQEMSALSFEKFKQKDFVDVAYFEPFYLKDFVLNR